MWRFFRKLYSRLKLKVTVLRARRMGLVVAPFSDFVKNPKLVTPRGELEVPWPNGRAMSGSEIRQALNLVHRYPHRAYSIRYRLLEEDPEKVQAGVSQLFQKLSPEELLDRTLVMHLLWATVHDPGPEMVPFLVRGYESSTEYTHQFYAEHLARSGAAHAGDALVPAVKGHDMEIIKSICRGREEALNAPHPEFERLLSEQLAELFESTLSSEKFYHFNELWLWVDKPSAVERLTRPPYWTVQSQYFRMLIHALADFRANVKHDRLQHILGEIRGAGPDGKIDYRGPLLEIAAASSWPEYENLAREVVAQPASQTADSLRTHLIKSRTYAAGAGNGLKCLKYWRRGDNFVRRAPLPVQECLALEALFVEVYNGGIEQYFFNSAGDWWPEVLSALKRIPRPEVLHAFRSAVEAFGSEQPSTDRGRRMNQLSRISKSSKQVFTKSSNVLIDTAAEDIIWSHVLANVEFFKNPTLP